MRLVLLGLAQGWFSSLAGQTLTWGRESSYHHLVSNMPRIFWHVNWVSDEWGAQLPFLACCLESESEKAEDLPLQNTSQFYVHTYFIRHPAAIQKSGVNLTRLSPPE